MEAKARVPVNSEEEKARAVEMPNDEEFLKEKLQVAYRKNLLSKVYPFIENVLTLQDVAATLSQTIYRIESFDDAMQNFSNNKLYFRSPLRWTDSLDSAFVRTPIRISDGVQADHDYKDELFCQCWSSHDTELMWQLYSRKDKGIMLVSTVGKIIQAIWDNSALARQYKYVGKVCYVPKLGLQDKAFFKSIFKEEHNLFESSGRGIAHTLLFKEDSFKPEQEIRFIAWERESKGHESLLIPVQGRISDSIDKIKLHPRAGHCFNEEVREFFNGINILVEDADGHSGLPGCYEI